MPWQTVIKPKSLGGLGIKDLASMNKAFAMKHLWRLLSGSSSLWARTYKEKYFPRANILEAKKSLVDFRLALKWKIGSGNISFWYENWAGGQPISELADDNHHIQNANLKVKDLFEQDLNRWNIGGPQKPSS